MTTTPAGSPPWTGTASIDAYGGHADKANYLGQGAINPRTDIDAAQIQRLAADLTACVRVMPFATLKIQCSDTSPDDPTVLWCRMQNGARDTPYAGDAPPSGFPTVTRVSDGSFRVTFDANPVDDFGVAGPLNIKAARGDVSGDFADVSWTESDPDTDGYNERVTFTINDGAAVLDSLLTVEIYV